MTKPKPEISAMLCPFCSAPWTEENIKIWDVDSADQCDSGRFEPPTYSISIKCHACKREMYRKEGARESTFAYTKASTAAGGPVSTATLIRSALGEWIAAHIRSNGSK